MKPELTQTNKSIYNSRVGHMRAALLCAWLVCVDSSLPATASHVDDDDNCPATCGSTGISCDEYILLSEEWHANGEISAPYTCPMLESYADCNCVGCQCGIPDENAPCPITCYGETQLSSAIYSHHHRCTTVTTIQLHPR